METRALLKFSLVTALISIFIITILANNLEPSIRKIDTINENNLDEWVKIRGTVTRQKEYETLKIITVNDGTASIDCILRVNTEPLENKTVEILGKIVEYKGNFEVDIHEIRIIK